MSWILTLLKTTWAIFKVFVIPCVFVLGLIFIMLMVYFLVFCFRGYKLPKGEHNHVKRASFLRNMFYLFPLRFIKDYFGRDPEFFRHQGCIVFTGRQGMGKTIAMVEQCKMWQMEYPKAKVISNLDYEWQDEKLDSWEKLLDYKNDIYGVICLMDEMQNWFSSNQSRNFPPEMLEVITQNRKNRRVIMGTAQVFTRLAKPIREQATEVRKCMTLCGCITIVHRVRPELDSSGDVVKWKHVGFYWFVHTDALRDCYDTYAVIEALRDSGFQPKLPDFSE